MEQRGTRHRTFLPEVIMALQPVIKIAISLIGIAGNT
jgi:hypothetical protein